MYALWSDCFHTARSSVEISFTPIAMKENILAIMSQNFRFYQPYSRWLSFELLPYLFQCNKFYIANSTGAFCQAISGSCYHYTKDSHGIALAKTSSDLQLVCLSGRKYPRWFQTATEGVAFSCRPNPA